MDKRTFSRKDEREKREILEYLRSLMEDHSNLRTELDSLQAKYMEMESQLAAVYPDRLQVMLGGSLATVQVTKVCTFIGHVIRMQVINDEKLQAVDLLFAFEGYYDKPQRYRQSLVKRTRPTTKMWFWARFRAC